MIVFNRKSAIDKEWQRLLKQEEKFIEKRLEKKESMLNQKLADKVPEKLNTTLKAAFCKAFSVIFEKGVGVIEKTYNRETIEKNHKVQQYAVDTLQDKRSYRSMSKKAGQSGAKNLLLSGTMGIGMGIVGMGLPDIPLFTGMILKSIYEIALHYGYQYESKAERLFILYLIQGAVSYGDSLQEINSKVNVYIRKGQFKEEGTMETQIKKTADLLSKELLYMKFLQGIPIVGVVGGACDAVYMKRITEYAELKYRHRYLNDQKR